VEVSADNANGEAVYEGFEMTDIKPDQVNPGGEIQMNPVDMSTDTDGDSFTNDFGMEFRRIRAGRFLMGSPEAELGRDSNEIQHWVTLTQDYYMQVTEVTQAQWRAVVQEVQHAGIVMNITLPFTPSNFSACGNDCPVEHVSWNEVSEFIRVLNQLGQGTFALPTEAQWEYAARGGTTTALPTGDNLVEDCNSDRNLEPIAWYCGNSYGTTHPVQGKNPNPFGLYDMHGNVWEWCADWLDDYPTTDQIDPHGPESGTSRVLRGGSYLNSINCRSANRSNYRPDFVRSDDLGFRLICRQFRRQ